MRRFCVSVMKELNVMEKSSGYETLCSYDLDLEISPCRTWPRFPLCGWSPEQVTPVLIRVFNDSWLYLICELICDLCWLMCADCRRADDESLLVLSTWTHSRRQRSQHALWGEACLISSAFCHWVCVVVVFSCRLLLRDSNKYTPDGKLLFSEWNICLSTSGWEQCGLYRGQVLCSAFSTILQVRFITQTHSVLSSCTCCVVIIGIMSWLQILCLGEAAVRGRVQRRLGGARPLR